MNKNEKLLFFWFLYVQVHTVYYTTIYPVLLHQNGQNISFSVVAYITSLFFLDSVFQKTETIVKCFPWRKKQSRSKLLPKLDHQEGVFLDERRKMDEQRKWKNVNNEERRNNYRRLKNKQ